MWWIQTEHIDMCTYIQCIFYVYILYFCMCYIYIIYTDIGPMYIMFVYVI